MIEERANFVGRFWREDMLKFAGLLLDFRFAVQCKAVGEEPLGKAVSPDDVSGALTPPIRQTDDQTAVSYRDPRGFQGVMARVHEGLVIVPLGRVRGGRDQAHFSHPLDREAHGQCAMDFHALDLSRLSVFFENPKFFEHFVKLLFVSHGENFLRRDLAVVQFNSAIA
jgi:hypothetical protein